jgi:flagellar M-ring protein FliF
MSEFFKQLLTQFRDIWSRFNTIQKVTMIAAFSITFVGLLVAVSVNSLDNKETGNATLFANMDTEGAANIVAYLKDNKLPYALENDGRTITVPKEKLYEVRMELARNGLPGQTGKGYELFDKTNLGVTDFVQNLNYKRAVEAELVRSIETLKEVDKARVHITIPKETIFTEKKEEAQAAVIVKLKPGEDLKEKQIKGITNLIASAVEGLKARQVQILDDHGNLLTKGFADNELAERADHNMEMQRSVEKYLEDKVTKILEGVVGPNKSKVKVSAELDFDQIQKTVESYDPQRKVVRSEQRDDGTRKNVPPEAGEEVKEGSITNYEIDKTVANIVGAQGATKRMTISVAVDGTYEVDKEGKKNYVPRTPEQVEVLNRLVKNAVGFSASRLDEVYVASVQFDNQMIETEIAEMKKSENEELYKEIIHWALILIIVFAGIFAVRRVIRDVVIAMNPPLPRYAGIDLDMDDEDDDVSQDVARQNEIVDRMESMTRDNPENVAELIRAWLTEDGGAATTKKKKK